MRLRIAILVLVAAGVCSLAFKADAQRKRSPKTTVDESARPSTQKHVASLRKIARELRRAGQADVAAKIEAQARRLMGTSKSKKAGASSKSMRADRRPLTKAKSKAGKKSRAKAPYELTPEAKAAPRPTKARGPNTPQKARTQAQKGGKGVWTRTPSSRAVPWVRVQAPDPVKVPVPTPVSVWRNRVRGADVLIPQKGGLPGTGDARIGTGRSRFRYAPVPTGRDSKGRVTWLGLPGRAKAGATSVAPRAAASKSNRNLEQRVEALSKEVRAMRETLNKLSTQLTKERRTRLIR